MSTSVLFVAPTLDSGGAERVMVHLLNHLDRTRFSPQLALGAVRGSYLAELRPDVVVHELGALQSWRLLPALIKLVRRERPQVVFSTMYSNFAVLLARPFFGSGTAVVVRESSPVAARLQRVARRSRLRARLIEFLLRRLYHRADAVICQSEEARREMQQLLRLRPERLVCIANPVDIARIEVLAAEAPDTEPETSSGPALLAVGRLRPEKAYDLLLDAFALLTRRCPAARLTIVGDGDSDGAALAALQAQARRLGIAGQVNFAGAQSNPYRFMRGSDLLVSSSRYEAFSNVLLEAMACGTPAVATNCPGGNREICEEGLTGLLCPPGDAAALAVAIEEALANPAFSDCAAIAASCRRRFAAEAIVPFYEQVLAGAAAANSAGQSGSPQ